MRDESDYSIGLRGALEETMSIAQISGVKTQVSHLKCIGPVTWGQADILLSRIDEMRRGGYDVIADQYPYTGSSTMLAGAVFPRWVQAGGRAEALQRIEDPALYDRLKKDISCKLIRGNVDISENGVSTGNEVKILHSNSPQHLKNEWVNAANQYLTTNT